MKDLVQEKYQNLQKYLKSLTRVAVAFSGGVDSTLILKVAHDLLGENAIAVTARSFLFPERETSESIEFCRKEEIKQIFVDFDPLSIPEFPENPKNRCYFCKKHIFTSLKYEAEKLGFEWVLEGSNMDDLGDYRPGLQAVSELGIKSPLRECNLYKSEIRQILKELQLNSLSEKPGFACLASRFVYGQTITKEKVLMLDKAEQFLLNLGLKQERVRIHQSGNIKSDEKNPGGLIARIEVLPQDFELIIENHQFIVDEFKKIGFDYISLDLQGYRTGSMNEVISK